MAVEYIPLTIAGVGILYLVAAYVYTERVLILLATGGDRPRFGNWLATGERKSGRNRPRPGKEFLFT